MADTLDLSPLKDAITSLEEGFALYSDKAWFDAQPRALRNTITAGIIQNFEFVWEIGIKMIRRRIEMDAATPTETDFGEYKTLLRSAGERGLIADVEAWFQYRKMRNITSHTYDKDKARKVLEGVSPFLTDAHDLLDRLEQRNA